MKKSGTTKAFRLFDEVLFFVRKGRLQAAPEGQDASVLTPAFGQRRENCSPFLGGVLSVAGGGRRTIFPALFARSRKNWIASCPSGAAWRLVLAAGGV
ncbi:MAG: hypothetical protein ACLR6S_02835 [Lacrimispora saccharolytica]